ncbi:NUDIX domain-containing protein [Corynebacterium aurimucosum]
MSETANSSSSPAGIAEIVAVILRDNHGRVLVIRATDTPEFVLPFGSIDETINPARAAQLIAHEAVRAAVDMSKLRRLATYVSPAANDAPQTIHAHVYVCEEEISVAHPDKEIAELAWVDPAAPDVTVAPLLRERAFPALQDL